METGCINSNSVDNSNMITMIVVMIMILVITMMCICVCLAMALGCVCQITHNTWLWDYTILYVYVWQWLRDSRPSICQASVSVTNHRPFMETVCMYVCMFACMHVYVCVYIYIYICIYIVGHHRKVTLAIAWLHSDDRPTLSTSQAHHTGVCESIRSSCLP